MHPFDNRNWIVTVTWSVECDPTEFAMHKAVTVEGGRKVVKQGFKINILDKRHRRSSMCQLKTEGEHKWTERPPRKIQVICQDELAVEQLEEIKMSCTTNKSIAILRMTCSFLSVMRAVLSYAGAFQL